MEYNIYIKDNSDYRLIASNKYMEYIPEVLVYKDEVYSTVYENKGNIYAI